MRTAQRAVTCRCLDDLIALLDEERETRDCIPRPELAFSMGVLRDEAFRGGASERTVGLIQAVEIVLALHERSIGSHALQ